MSDEPYDAANPRHVKAAAKAAKQADLQIGSAVRGIMSVASGRAWMLDILERCHVFHSTFSPNALIMSNLEGERNIGLQFLNDIMRYCPDDYILMMREKHDRELSENTSRRQNPTGGDGGLPDRLLYDEAGRWIGYGPDPRVEDAG